MNLNLFLAIPIATLLALFFARDAKQVRWISFIGMSIQLLLSFVLLFAYLSERKSGATTPLLFEQSLMWYASWNIHYHIGVDGIAVAMILLTSVVMVSGILISWNIERWVKEFYVFLILLGT